jgi:hypothetical protein
MKESAIKSTRTESIALACTTVSSLLLSGRVIACIVYVLQTLASLVTVRPAFAQSTSVAPGVRLEADIEKEDVDGDLKSAMDIYQNIPATRRLPAMCVPRRCCGWPDATRSWANRQSRSMIKLRMTTPTSRRLCRRATGSHC